MSPKEASRLNSSPVSNCWAVFRSAVTKPLVLKANEPLHKARQLALDKNSSAKEIMDIVISKVVKESEYVILASFIKNKEYFDDNTWANEVLKFQENL